MQLLLQSNSLRSCRFGLVLVLLLALFTGCKHFQEKKVYQKIEGKCMGTTYHITYATEVANDNIQRLVDSTLYVFEDELSTYRPHSIISQFNEDSIGVCAPKMSHFIMSLYGAKSIHRVING